MMHTIVQKHQTHLFRSDVCVQQASEQIGDQRISLAQHHSIITYAKQAHKMTPGLKFSSHAPNDQMHFILFAVPRCTGLFTRSAFQPIPRVHIEQNPHGGVLWERRTSRVSWQQQRVEFSVRATSGQRAAGYFVNNNFPDGLRSVNGSKMAIAPIDLRTPVKRMSRRKTNKNQRSLERISPIFSAARMRPKYREPSPRVIPKSCKPAGY